MASVAGTSWGRGISVGARGLREVLSGAGCDSLKSMWMPPWTASRYQRQVELGRRNAAGVWGASALLAVRKMIGVMLMTVMVGVS